MTTPKDRGAILRAINAAPTLAAQARLVAQLDEMDRTAAVDAAREREIDWAATVVTETLTPAPTFERTSSASDWLAGLGEPEVDRSAIVAQAGLWFSQLSPEVRADEAEFTEQAKGLAHRVAAGYGAGREEAVQVFTDYAAFLRAQAGSGLDQIQQTTAPDGVTNKPTELPTDVFDNFAPPVHELNSGSVGTETSERNPLLQEIMSGNGGQGTPEKPGGHSTTDELSWNPPGGGNGPSPAPAGDGGQGSPEQLGGHQDGGDVPRRAQAASGLPQIQQAIDVHDHPAPTPLPEQVMFPWEMSGEEHDEGGHAVPGGVPARPAQHTTAGRQVQADQWSHPHQTVQPNIANTPASTPPAAPGTAAQGAADGKDPAGQAPSFSDGHAARSYVDAYTSAQPASVGQDVPVSLGGDNGQGTKKPQQVYASRHVATRQEMQHPDFQRGYRYAMRWRPGTPLVLAGTAEMEAGIYAGLTDHPAQRGEWIKEHQRLAGRAPALGQRIALHRRFTHQVAAEHGLPTDGTYLQAQAATTLQMDTTAPGTSADPSGSTPINGPGRPGPLAGGMDAAAAGGPSPYNGAAPTGAPVVPASRGVDSPGVVQTLPDSGMTPPQYALPASAAAFRRRVQAGLLQERNGEQS
ncbi:hypothetical protein [Kitasatospora viridis]|uniref:hypothetical protein n=1 Tax=Kitasatospora viridis TaxID=281105 RepID=UPI0011A7595A|nr:hypothetical protein [Kitasatospora viridis]